MMQQTEKYKLNLIETTDTFSPAPLNENAQKLETALAGGLAAARAEAAAATAAGDAAEAQARANADTAEAQARAAGDAALDQRVQVLELRKMVAGTYAGTTTGTSGSQIIELGFTPSLVVIQKPGTSESILPNVVVLGGIAQDSSGAILKIVSGGFYVAKTSNRSLNSSGITYCFFAIG